MFIFFFDNRSVLVREQLRRGNSGHAAHRRTQNPVHRPRLVWVGLGARTLRLWLQRVFEYKPYFKGL